MELEIIMLNKMDYILKDEYSRLFLYSECGFKLHVCVRESMYLENNSSEEKPREIIERTKKPSRIQLHEDLLGNQ